MASDRNSRNETSDPRPEQWIEPVLRRYEVGALSNAIDGNLNDGSPGATVS